jgi:chemotaxis protein histidine kinase CheA
MSDLQGREDLLRDFPVEAGDRRSAADEMQVEAVSRQHPGQADPCLPESRRQAIAGNPACTVATVAATGALLSAATNAPAAAEPDWERLFAALTEAPEPFGTAGRPAARARAVPAETIIRQAVGRRSSDQPGLPAPAVGRRAGERQSDSGIGVDSVRLDPVRDLSGEIDLARNRLNALREHIVNGRSGAETLLLLDRAIGQLDRLADDLRHAAGTALM